MKKSLSLTFLLVIPTFGDHHREAKKERAGLPAGLPSGSNPTTLEEAGFKSLFNGKNLTGWKKVGGTANYEVKNGAIRGFGNRIRGNTFLRTTEEYGDFIFTFQFKFIDKSGMEILMAGSPVTSASMTILRMGHALGLLVFTMNLVVDG